MEGIAPIIPARPIRFVDRFRQHIRSNNLSYATEKTYVGWVVRFIRFHKFRHPEELNDRDIESFLDHLSVRRNCSANTQKTALNALIFLYRQFCNARVST